MKQEAKKNLLTKKLLPASLTALLFVAGPGLAANIITGGTVNFTGEVITTACEVSSSSVTLPVDMGEVGTNTLKTAGSEAPTKRNFTIQLSGCDASVLKSVAVTFTGDADPNDTTALATTGTATKVAIRLYDTDGTRLNLGATSKAKTLTNGDTPLNFSASYISPQGTATAGSVNATATYTLTYS